MILVYLKIGPDRLPIQLGRLLLQLVIMAPIVLRRSNTALLVLAGYHLLSVAISLGSSANDNWLAYSLFAFHVIIAFVIYFHDVIEVRLFPALNHQPPEADL